MKKKAAVIFYSILILIIVLNILSKFQISLFGINIFKIASGSMEPYLKINDVIIIKKANELHVGDIITFKDKKSDFITHRIVEIDDDVITTKGETNNTNDEPITREMVVGKLIYRTKIISFLNYLFSSLYSWILLFVIGLVFVIILSYEK